jgi:TolA-binding protein
LLILFLLVMGSGPLLAAGSKKEEHAYAAAVGAFQDGLWSPAETELAQFVEKYPDSSHLSEAVLLQAEAEIKLGKLTDAIARLKAGQAAAGDRADEYIYWIGAAQLASGDFSLAAETLLSLAQNNLTSRLRLRAVVEAAVAFSELHQWPQVTGLLEETNGVFQQAVKLDPGNELVARGELLLAQAKFAGSDFTGAAALLQSMNSSALSPELDWQRVYLLCQARLATGDLEAALAATTNLLQIATVEKGDLMRAERVALRAEVLEKMGQSDAAQAAFRENLVTNAPIARQRQAVLKIAELAIAQKQYSNAVPVLETFLAQFPDSSAADTVLLTLGELHLKSFVAQPALTNQLARAQQRFEQFIVTFTNSPLLASAYLDHGWCRWLADQKPESFDDFRTAAQKIAALNQPPSKELLVAWFKMGDAQFAQKDFAGALENYRAVLEGIKISPGAGESLADPVLYQILRTSVEMNDAASASNAFARIYQKHPVDGLMQSSSLLYGESLARPDEARALFGRLATQLPGSPLQPQIALAVARSYEREQDWPAAVTNYEDWLKTFPTNGLKPQVVYALAQADFHGGNETNAFQTFTNFVAQFPTNALAPLAQWWVGDYFFRTGDFVNAERNYKSVFENWPVSDLAYPSRMMAGRAAVARLDYIGAIRDYFIKLEPDTNCPIDLRIQATFAHGDALMRSDSTVSNNPLANFQAATNVFAQVYQKYPTNEWGALALFYIGECALQLADYDAATNAFGQVMASPALDQSARDQAQIGLGIALEKKAALATGTDQRTLLKQALNNYLAVFDSRFQTNSKPFWVRKAGLQALPLAGQIGGADDLNEFIDDLENLFPQSKALLEKKRLALLAEKK